MSILLRNAPSPRSSSSRKIRNALIMNIRQYDKEMIPFRYNIPVSSTSRELAILYTASYVFISFVVPIVTSISLRHLFSNARSIFPLPSFPLPKERSTEIPLMYSSAAPTISSCAFCISSVCRPAESLIFCSTNIPAPIPARDSRPTGRQNTSSIAVMTNACTNPPSRYVSASIQYPSRSETVVVSTDWIVPRLFSEKYPIGARLSCSPISSLFSLNISYPDALIFISQRY